MVATDYTDTMYVTCIGIGKDSDLDYIVKKCKQYNIPYGVYWYCKFPKDVKTAAAKEAHTRKEAQAFYKYAAPHNPLFWCVDAEEESLTDASLCAFIDELRKLIGVEGKIGLYYFQSWFARYPKARKLCNFDWLSRFGENKDTYNPKFKPSYPCAIHQYTSNGKANPLGFKGKALLDKNRLTGSIKYGWFTNQRV